MRRSFLVVSTAALAGALALGCGDQPTPSEPGNTLPSSAVFRTRFDEGFLVHTIPDRGLAFTIGLLTPIGDACNGAPAEFDIKAFNQIVETSAGPLKLLDHVQGTFVVYDHVLLPEDDFCDLAAAPVIGSGPGTFTRNDNDILAVGPGNNTFGYRAKAILDLTGGGKAQLHVVLRLHFDGVNIRTLIDEVELKPIGG
jgi:hypothetical protein